MRKKDVKNSPMVQNTPMLKRDLNLLVRCEVFHIQGVLRYISETLQILMINILNAPDRRIYFIWPNLDKCLRHILT